MDRVFTTDVQNGEKETTSLGNAFLRDTGSEDSLFLLEKSISGPNSEMSRVLSQFTAPLTAEQLEMLEAELIHQGVLPNLTDRSIRLGHTLSHEINLLRWYARRSGLAGSEISFVVDLPRYILSRASVLAEFRECGERESNWRLNSSLSEHDEFAYLERFAAFLLADRDGGKNRYQKGLNLILRVLARSERSLNAKRSTPEETHSLVLPMQRRELLKILRERRSKFRS